MVRDKRVVGADFFPFASSSVLTFAAASEAASSKARQVFVSRKTVLLLLPRIEKQGSASFEVGFIAGHNV